MTVILQDPTSLGVPSSRHPLSDAVADANLIAQPMLADAVVTASQPDAPSTSTITFELESHGGYERTVKGTIAYLDDEAQTYMVRKLDGQLARVPLRDITSARVDLRERDGLSLSSDLEGLGTGGRRSTSGGAGTG
jgi:hypothetical protein